jgi:hypothetical protein
VFSFFSVGPTTMPAAFVHWLESEQKQERKSRSESRDKRPPLFPCGNLPEPTPMQSQMD